MGTTATVKVDLKGRLIIPRRRREELGIEPGDTFFVQTDGGAKVLRYARAGNPFDTLAEHALEERRAGRTRSVRAFAAENDLDLGAG